MKYITSTTGKKISFAVNGKTKLLIDTVVPIQISDEDYDIVRNRLGGQISFQDHSKGTDTEKVKTPEVKNENSELTPVVDPQESVKTDPENDTGTV